MSSARSRWSGIATMLATAAVVLAGCGEPAPVVEDDLPVAVAEPVSFEATGLTPRPTPSPTPDAPAEPSPEPAADDGASPEPPPSGGPTSADAAAFVASGALAGLDGLEHVVVDLDGDSVPEVVATGVRDRVGVIRVAWWTGRSYEVLAADEGGPGRDVTDLRAADVNQDGRTELLVTVDGEGLRSLAIWGVTGSGEIQRLRAVGGCHDGSHVFGITTARLQSAGEDPPVVVADCDESPLPVADWSEQWWAWQDGAYRHVEDEPPGRSGDDNDAGDVGGDGSNGNAQADGGPGADAGGGDAPGGGSDEAGDGSGGGDSDDAPGVDD